jgi:hypothetical protein
LTEGYLGWDAEGLKSRWTEGAVETERDKTRGGCCWKTSCNVFDCLLVEDVLGEVQELEGLGLGRVSEGTGGKGERTFVR